MKDEEENEEENKQETKNDGKQLSRLNFMNSVRQKGQKARYNFIIWQVSVKQMKFILYWNHSHLLQRSMYQMAIHIFV